MKKTVAIIPARGGSKGVPGKNVRRVGGISLIGRSVLAAKAAHFVSEVFVSTDDKAIAAEAARFGASIIWRPAEISGDTASSEAAIHHAIDELEAAGNRPDVIAFLQCTSPFTSGKDVDAVLTPVIDGIVPCAFSAAEDHGFLWQLDGQGHAAGVNHDHTKQRIRRQDLPKTYRETGAVYAFDVNAFRTVGTRFCGPAKAVSLDNPILEIDSLDDFRAAQMLSPLFPAPVDLRLKTVRALIMDFDGVHTDDAVYVDQDGSESVRCSRRDGLGIDRLRRFDVAMLILSKERNPVVTSRAAKLKVEVEQGCDNKKEALEAWLEKRNIALEDAVYVGNDVNDLECMGAVGFSFAPRDAHGQALAAADFITEAPGGNGAIREICDLLMSARLRS